MLPVILTLLASTVATPAAVEAPRQDPAIRVWLNKRGYVERTDKVRAYVRTGVDGYVVILHAEPSGRVRVLFPLDPEDDAFVRAGRDYEIRSRSDREAFAVYDGSGTGVVLAAVSRDPFRYEGLVLNRHWDYRAVEFGVGNDAEADLLALVQQMTGGAWFDYDVVRYELANYFVTEATGVYRPSFYGPLYAGHYWTDHVGFTITFGTAWYDPWYYPPYYWWSGYYPGYWTPCCYYDWYRPYRTYAYYYPYYGYPYYGYPRSWPRGDRYVRHVYPAGYGNGAWGSYAFKSTEDRYGLQPQTVTARRRTTGTEGVFASSPSRTPANATRRTPVAGAPSSSPASGTLEARRRPSSTANPAVLPTINGRGRRVATPPAEAGNDVSGAEGRRVIGEARTPETGRDVVRRGLQIAPPGRNDTPTQDRANDGGRRTVIPSSPTGVRQVEPRRIGESPARPAQGTVGSGRTIKPSTGSLERRSPARTVVPRPSSPTRTVSPPRSTPPARSAPQAVPRPPTRSSPPARSSSPPPSGRRKK